MKNTFKKLIFLMPFIVASCSEAQETEFEKKMNKSADSYLLILEKLAKFSETHKEKDLTEGQKIWILQHNCVMHKNIVSHMEFLMANVEEYNKTYNFHETKESIAESSVEHAESYIEYLNELASKGKKCEISDI
ncbi:hypothetical protein I9054_011280 [Acinetobacter bereziniae]|uniref:Uncharacterized protein n=1 Tax=Acinetobacter bereziniae TaxID=106648 RepID=A0A8I1DHX1_ACIBZ|nr:hypothetical protein [Acinetobacter bereziniae]QQC82824.1 hypothetical protein I9190_10865 [Acinetobacter bereziniae]UUN95968.1 hypothetical protein I9054_011280 [Acinetobacter bereziniae]